MPSYEQIVNGLSSYPHRLYRVLEWRANSNVEQEDTREPVDDLAEADVITSEIADKPGWHTIMLDLDVPHTYVPSTTPGHGHLYIDVMLRGDEYIRLLGQLANVGIIQPGYVGVSRSRGWSSLRLPWVKKEKPVIEEEAAF